ncbi:MAG: phenylalanine--tRNA ligase subunit alpha [Deltaproteobacteria bacterium]|nr:MAG: phenylalanine--tRNA ligase subunit alpha [Deltaproteobacteria bacterium]
MGDLASKVEEIRSEAEEKLRSATTEKELLEIKGKYFGRKGALSEILRSLPTLPVEERRVVGQKANETRKFLESLFDESLERIKEEARKRKAAASFVDVTLPGGMLPPGHRHPITATMEEINRVFSRLGFTIFGGPDIETDYYNFEALNIPKEHPARDMQDTFYVENLDRDILLRTHTSPIQIRVMEKLKPPVRVIAPGTVYRCDSDVTHSPMFHQVEGFAVDRDITFADLKGVLTEFCALMFGQDRGVRFRPSYFPFTEPSAEVDIECVICGGEGCRVCSETGWLEILGCGMIDPEVFRYVGYDPEEFSGFAFGMGVERIAMLRHGIGDIRLFFENDLRFLTQF